MPVAYVTLLFKAEVWNVRQRVFECVRVLADTASEAQMCTDDYCADTVPALVTIQGVNSSANRTSIRTHQRWKRANFSFAHDITPSISGGRSHVLLHAETCH